MIQFFRYDGPIFKLGNLLFNLLILNFLWVIFSLPLITVGASTASLYYVVGKMIREDEDSVILNFIRGFKENFKQATILSFILFGLGGILAFNIMNIEKLDLLGRLLLPLLIVIGFEILITFLYVFPIIATYRISIIDSIKNSLILGNIHIFTTILCTMMLIGIYYMTSLWNFYLFISIFAYTAYQLLYRIFKGYNVFK